MRMLKVLFVHAMIDPLFSRDFPLLGELSSGMSLRDIRNGWLSHSARPYRGPYETAEVPHTVWFARTYWTPLHSFGNCAVAQY